MAGARSGKQIASKSEDFDRWYVDVVRRAELADYAPVKGCMVIRPYGYALWERTRDALDAMIKRTGHENMYFPLLIPESYLAKEAEHVEGFAPEVFWVTQGGTRQLEERLAIRPTSETIICSMYADWIHSWRDLPVLINQWCNVARWEKRTRLFLRTAEFLWQEGHTFHATDEEAAAEVDTMLDCYRELAEEWLAMPVIKGRKTESEKFAGARYTLSIEAMMSDGWALQAGTSHHLAQNFTTAYGIRYSDRDNALQHPFQTSWGLSTRIIGGLIMAHGDEAGLVIPPRVAPIQVVVVPITRSDDDEAARIDEACSRIEREVPADVRVRVDRREAMRPGEKFAHWELRGVPVRITVGAKDLVEGNVTLVRRFDGEQTVVPLEGLGARLQSLLDEVQLAMRARAQGLLDQRSVDVQTLDDLVAAFTEQPVFASGPFCNRAECEQAVKASVHALTIRNLRSDRSSDGAPCVACREPAEFVALMARAY
ncbi:MAG: proline--tRNA ligase [Candidatus Dormibacteraeota bacterium]|uniref:Proline--tRNA ligase n=2 Tax=Candidatus Aeolococcaceae TaxID=3127005 RepID=A0A934JXC8_9BACT|nr:proline--tRNA ligase [Candidatus Dormibacteraeota bacterium]MBJ7610240.1 proline--tRNA ligase [Candidatus Dormibacteraeota bacterium]